MLPTDYLLAAGLPLKNTISGPWMKSVPWDAGKLLLNGPDGSTFDERCNQSFT
jgi:hypothetical protein